MTRIPDLSRSCDRSIRRTIRSQYPKAVSIAAITEFRNPKSEFEPGGTISPPEDRWPSIPLRFYNTLTRRLENFEPIEPGHVRLYTCGPTVYDFSHIGNLRTFLFEDVLRRTLGVLGFDVTQVMNLTDVDDKTIREATAAGLGLRDYTEHFIEAFFDDLDTLRVERAEHYPRATDYIPQMVELVATAGSSGPRLPQRWIDLLQHLHASRRTASCRASDPKQTSSGARVDNEEYEKDDARDFVLWKGAREGEPSWETAIGPGRPGWHLECSAMSIALLGEELRHPHRRRRQHLPPPRKRNRPVRGRHRRAVRSLLAARRTPRRRGREDGQIEGQLLHPARSSREQGHDPVVIRYLLISVPYRQKLNFTMDGLHAAEQAIDRIGNTLRASGPHPGRRGRRRSRARATVDEFRRDFRDALGDDLNTARALGALHTLLRQVNTALDGGGISDEVRGLLRQALDEVDSVLGHLSRRRNRC